MPSPHPLDFPEILSAVGAYLLPGSLTSCVRVSRHWHQTLLSLVWRYVRLEHFSPVAPEAQYLHKNRYFVRSLVVGGDVAEELTFLRFPTLRTLTLLSLNSGYAAAMVQAHPSLVHLEISGGRPTSYDVATLEAVMRLPRLRSLSANLSLDEATVDLFWAVCTRIERLRLHDAIFRVDGHLDSMMFSNIRELVLHNDSIYNHRYPRKDLEIMQRCPKLETLSWRGCWESGQEFFHLAAAGTWPYLENLTMAPTQTGDVKQALAFQQLKRISFLKIGVFGPRSFQAIRPHFATLKTLYLTKYGLATSAMMQELLSSCPVLEELIGDSIHADDIAHGQPWIRTRLRHLVLCINFDPSTIDEYQPLIFKQFSRLTRLEHLDVCWDRVRKPDDSDLSLVRHSSRVTFPPSIDLGFGKGLDLPLHSSCDMFDSSDWLRRYPRRQRTIYGRSK
ncbi:hypothetical protein BGZ98_010377 [Dissophora globulifera]|nr:hypothetical protein BGZ98_010377 [Dissophora globulifera]